MNINSCQIFDQKTDRNRLQKSALGTITKSHSTFDQMPCPVDVSRVKDFLLQDLAGRVLQKKFRVQTCLKRKIDKTKLVNVCFNESTGKAHYGNVMRCGSVWTCPVCAKKITEHRRQELKLINEIWQSGLTLYLPQKVSKEFVGPPAFTHRKIEKGYTYLLTLTSPHYAYQSLSLLRERMKDAKTAFFGGSKNQLLFQKQLGKVFHITNLEVTYGQNGWHPHNHILIFSDKYLGIQDFSKVRTKLAKHWAKCLENVGVRKLKENELFIACDLRDGTYAEQYVSKWGLEEEMTKGHIKKGKEGGLTPFDLLRLSDEDHTLYDSKKPSELFCEFANAFKGARQLVFSRGLKHACRINDFASEDDETKSIMASVLDEALFLRDIEDHIFKLILKYKKRAEFLDALTFDFYNNSFLADDLIKELESRDLSSFETEIKPILNENSDSLARQSLPPKSCTPWISSSEFSWLQTMKNENLPISDEIPDFYLPMIAEHLAFLETQRG